MNTTIGLLALFNALGLWGGLHIALALGAGCFFRMTWQDRLWAGRKFLLAELSIGLFLLGLSIACGCIWQFWA